MLKQCPPLSAKSSSTSATSSTSGLQSPSASPQTSNPITQHLHGHHHHHNHHGHHSGVGGGAAGTSSGVNYHFSHSIKLTERSRAALVSLLLLVVEHHHALAINRAKSSSSPQQKSQAELHQQFSPDLLNYLLTILENLPNFKWVEDAFVSPSTATYYYSSSISSKSLSITNYYWEISEIWFDKLKCFCCCW